ncbi:MAG TPA: hypothetical protein VFA43_08140 [Gemmatimonadaceae bacterium]|nr:hypothetical protein [Gemmatimonadaceae bacterium]
MRLAWALPRGATLIDHVPRVRDTLPDGVRLLSADSLHIADGKVVGQVRVAFFRPDSQVVPSFAVAYRSSNGTDTLLSAPIPVFVRSVLPTGDATLRDIRDVDAPWPVTTLSIAVGVVLVLVLGLRALLRSTRGAPKAQEEIIQQGPSPYDLALEQLRQVEQSDVGVEHQYQQAADIVRGYIAATRGVPALERTTAEVLSALNVNGEVAEFFREADRVKFAGWRPQTYTAKAKKVIDALR